MNDKDLINSLKTRMGYSDSGKSCKTCFSFSGIDCSGEWNAKTPHCKLNATVEMPVKADGGGLCDFYCKK